MAQLWCHLLLIFALCEFGSQRNAFAVTVPPLGSSPLPTLNLGCIDDTEGTPPQEQQFYNETCHNDSDCYSLTMNSTVCRNGRCDCADGFIPEKQRTTDVSKRRLWVCNTPPGFNQPCTTVCQKPYTCALPPPTKDLAPTTPGTFDLPVAEQSGHQQFCLCKAPYAFKENECRLECKVDEFYHDFECKKLCQVNEVMLDDRRCKEMAGLGQACEDKRQCMTPFALCRAGRCTCADGFARKTKKDSCETRAYNCPFGDAMRDSSNIIPCSDQKADESSPSPSSLAKKPPSTSPTPVSSKFNAREKPAAVGQCPDSHFCVFATGDSDVGHCCQKPKIACPLGEPHPNATCGDSRQNPMMTNCPLDSHSCQRLSLYGYEWAACCPLACAQSHVRANGRCYADRDYGEKCEVDQQCARIYGVCENGACVCSKGFVATGNPPSYCSRQCGDYEVEVRGSCVPRLKLGDTCNPDDDVLCPSLAHCSKKQKKCICDCGYGRLDERHCASHPTCDFVSNATAIPTPTSEYNITGFTFCQLPATTKVVANAARQCPKNQYCADYTTDIGVCCPRPEKVLCPDGSAPTAKCDPSIPKACGGKGQCYKYINIAAPRDATDGHVCCYHK